MTITTPANIHFAVGDFVRRLASKTYVGPRCWVLYTGHLVEEKWETLKSHFESGRIAYLDTESVCFSYDFVTVSWEGRHAEIEAEQRWFGMSTCSVRSGGKSFSQQHTAVYRIKQNAWVRSYVHSCPLPKCSQLYRPQTPSNVPGERQTKCDNLRGGIKPRELFPWY